MTLSAALQAKKADLGGSWDLVARALSTSTSNVTRWNGGGEPGPEFYDRLMALFGVDLDELGSMIIREQLARFEARG